VACSPDERAFLGFIDPWLRDQVVEVFEDVCAPPSSSGIYLQGEEYVSCFRAWYAAISAGS